MVNVGVDVITITAYKCMHCDELFAGRDPAFEHLDKCPARAAKMGRYVDDTDYGNMILKEVVG